MQDNEQRVEGYDEHGREYVSWRGNVYRRNEPPNQTSGTWISTIAAFRATGYKRYNVKPLEEWSK